jgi:exopolysaccharide biosynthesis polyprenyl glycosylphosphotransferase
MVRLGIHYIEPRRVGFFVAEEAALVLAFVACASGASHALGLAVPPAHLCAAALVAGAGIAFALSLADLHDLRVALADALHGRRLLRVLGAVSLVAGVAVGLLLRRDPVAIAVAAGLGGASLAVIAMRAALPALGRHAALHTRVFLVGEGEAARRLVREIQRDGTVDVVGFAGSQVSDLARRARAAGARAVVVATDDRRGLPMEELLRCRTAGLDVTDAASFAARALHRLPIDLVKPSDLIYGDGFRAPLLVRFGRRAISVAAALTLLVLASPLLLLAALLITLDGDGPVLFRQERVGKDDRPFHMLKLRTMCVGAEAGGAKWAGTDDPRVTRVGKWLRRFRVDELPQLVNVLRGEMDLVGPRPERPAFVAMLRRHIPFYDLRHLVAPGITGWAQVCYPYAASVEEAREKLQYDLYYVRHLGVAFDLFILLLTARTILLGRGAR